MSSRTYSQPKPVRPYQRFPPMKNANTGIDPEGNWKHFIKGDPTMNVDVHRDRKY